MFSVSLGGLRLRQGPFPYIIILDRKAAETWAFRSDSPFRWFKSSYEVIRTAVLMYIRFPLSLRNVEDMLLARGYDVSCETIRYWWDRFGPMFAGEVRHKRVSHMRGFGIGNGTSTRCS